MKMRNLHSISTHSFPISFPSSNSSPPTWSSSRSKKKASSQYLTTWQPAGASELSSTCWQSTPRHRPPRSSWEEFSFRKSQNASSKSCPSKWRECSRQKSTLRSWTSSSSSSQRDRFTRVSVRSSELTTCDTSPRTTNQATRSQSSQLYYNPSTKCNSYSRVTANTS